MSLLVFFYYLVYIYLIAIYNTRYLLRLLKLKIDGKKTVTSRPRHNSSG